MIHVLLLTRDLLVVSLVHGAAERAGAGLDVAGDVTLDVEGTIDLVIVDLSMPALKISDLVVALHRSSPPPRICAFAPHVHEEKLKAAQEAGCDEVVPRGQLQSLVDRCLRAAAMSVGNDHWLLKQPVREGTSSLRND